MPAPQPSAPPQPTAQPVGNAPAAAGMLTPQEPSGQAQAGRLDMFHASKLMERAYQKLSPDDQKVALKMIAAYKRQFGEHEDEDEEFSPAEMKRMLATLAGPGATGPQPGSQPPGGAPPQAQPPQE